MRIARLGEAGHEKPAVLVGTEAIFVDSLIPDWDRETLSNGGYQKVASADLSALPRVDNKSLRIGSPIAHPTKVICVGLNYLLHIKETNAATPPEPIIFMKAPDSVVGPNDAIVIPPGSLKTDYEVELAIVIGKRALYLKDESESAAHIYGYLHLNSIWLESPYECKADFL